MKIHVVCFGDSNTHGYCPDPHDCADRGNRFNEDERWPCLLQQKLGSSYLVIEEGQSGRTTVFDDPLYEGMSALDSVVPILTSHEPIDLLILMLGTNDTKSRFAVEAPTIAMGFDRLIAKIKTIWCWGNRAPNILVICPPHIGEEIESLPAGWSMGPGCARRSRELSRFLRPVAHQHGCAFLDAQGIAEFNKIDYMHLTRAGHAALADKLAALVPTLL